MLQLLPTEIALHIASYLSLQSLYQVSLVCTEWHRLIANNKPTVYRNAAILHRFVPDDDDDNEAGSPSHMPDRRRRDWTQFCRRRLRIERGWRGKGPSQAKELTATGKSVHRIKVDQDLGFVITTCHTEGLYVTDISTNRVLWAIHHVAGSPHCEYDHGYIIFNRHDDGKEVWRLACDFQDSDIPEGFKPDESMVNASEKAASYYPSSTGHGHFRPWALLQMPEFTRAFRFSYPTMLSAGFDNAYLWDIPTSRLVETIRNTQVSNQDGPLGDINYVEVNDKYAFVCGSSQLRIFARGGGVLVYHLTEKMLPRTHWDVLESNNTAYPSSLFQPLRLQEASHVSESSEGSFKAAHVSSRGDLVALMASGIFIWIPDFERLIHHEANINEIAVVLSFIPSLDNVQDTSIYLALGESNEKAAVATCSGLYILALDPEISKLTAEAPPRPGMSVCRVLNYEHSQLLSSISCLQMTDTGIFFNWCPSSEQNRFSRPVRHITVPQPQPQPQPQLQPQPQPQPQPHPVAPVLSTPPTLATVGNVAASAQGANEEGHGDHLPGLVLVESSDEDDPEEDLSPDLLSPAHADPIHPIAFVDAPEEEEEDEEGGFHMEDDAIEDFDEEDLDEPDMMDDVQFNVQFNGNGLMQIMQWFHPHNPSMVHCIHV